MRTSNSFVRAAGLKSKSPALKLYHQKKCVLHITNVDYGVDSIGLHRLGLFNSGFWRLVRCTTNFINVY